MHHIVFGILLVHDDFSLTEGSNFSVFTSTSSIRTEKLDHYGMTGSRNLQKSRITGDYSFLYLFMLFLSGASMNSHLLNKKGIFTFLATLAVFSIPLNAADTRYKDRMFEVEKKKDVEFAVNVPHLSSLHSLTQMIYAFAGEYIYFYNKENDVTNQPLLLDLYTPKADNETKRAAIIVSHGGAMVAGAKDDTDQQSVNYCDSLAARGFVTASIQYRRGVTLTGSGVNYSIDSVDFARTVYRGVQDVSAAVRYMRKNADKLGIDPNRIYLLGNSAGAILSLENIYVRKEADFPSYINKTGAPELGGMDIYGEQGVDSHANGAVSLWGAIHNPNIIGENKTPVLLIHGTDDETVLFKTGKPLGEGFSMSNMTLNVQAPTLYGSYVIDSVLTAKNIEHETYFVNGADHEFYDDTEYEKPVQDKVFNFLYKLATSEVTTSTHSRKFAIAHKSAIQMQNGNTSFTVSSGKSLKFEILDIRGRTSMKGTVSAGQSIAMGSLSKGIYVLKVQGEQAIRFNLSK